MGFGENPFKHAGYVAWGHRDWERLSLVKVSSLFGKVGLGIDHESRSV